MITGESWSWFRYFCVPAWFETVRRGIIPEAFTKSRAAVFMCKIGRVYMLHLFYRSRKHKKVFKSKSFG